MEFKYNRNKTELLRVMKAKSEKKGLKIAEKNNKLQVSLAPGKFSNGEDAIPVTFQGTITGSDSHCSLKGKFSYGFYLYTLVIVAAVLIIARFIWSAHERQTDNMILCAIVTALLILIICVVSIKSKPAKKIINDFLNNLNVK